MEAVISGDVAQQIALDVSQNTPEALSLVKYGKAEREFKARIIAEFAAYRAKHPDAIFDVRSSPGGMSDPDYKGQKKK